MNVDWQARDLARLIDHTALKPDTTRDQIVQLCREARQFGFYSVCVAPCWVELAAGELQDSETVIASVIGFPHGNTLASVKAFEAERVVRLGGSELDMVLNVGALKSGDLPTVRDDIHAVVAAARQAAADLPAALAPPKVKVILETALLTDDEKRLACQLAAEAGADFVKTSTGFAGGGATTADIALMRRVVGDALGVKASGGIRDYTTAIAMLEAGANRLGCSSSVAIIEQAMQLGR